MRVLVVSTLFPPVARGGYEVECSRVVERLRERHEVLVLTSDTGRAELPAEDGIRRELTFLTLDSRGAVRAPLASVRGAEAARRALAWGPDFIYAWNGSMIPQAALRVLADSPVPLAFRVCEHWFGGLFTADQFLRELGPGRRSPPRALWALGCRAVNALPSLRLTSLAPLRAAISWNAETLREAVPVPPFVDVVLERVGHSVPPNGDLYAAVERSPAPSPEIVFLGRVTPYKGLDVAIRALAQLRHELGVDATLTVVGSEDAAHGGEMRRLAEHENVSGAVRWLGQQPPEQAAAVLARAHALIVPSVWEEPFPLVTIEGALARVPIVASDVGGISEGMHDEQHALLFPRGDAAAAAEALARIVREPNRTAARVARAFERAQAFRIGPYLDEQEQFVLDAYGAFRSRRADASTAPP